MGSIDDEVNARIKTGTVAAIEAAKVSADALMAAHVAQYHSGAPVPPDPPVPPTTGRYANLVGFASLGFKQNTKTLENLADPLAVWNALQTPGAAFRLVGNVELPVIARVASGVYCDLNEKRLTVTPGAPGIMEFGDFGRPVSAVSDCAIVNGHLGPALGGNQQGDGARVHAGSTRIWLDRIDFDFPFGDEAFSVLHYFPEPKSQMRVSLTTCKWWGTGRSPAGNSNFAALIGDGSDPTSELGKRPGESIEWEKQPPREPPIQVTLYNGLMNDVFWRCPLTYHGWIHVKGMHITKWNHPNANGMACGVYGAAEALVEDCIFDKAGSDTTGAAIGCEAANGYTPRLTQRRNTFLGDYTPSGGPVVRNGAIEAALTLPYVL